MKVQKAVQLVVAVLALVAASPAFAEISTQDVKRVWALR